MKAVKTVLIKAKKIIKRILPQKAYETLRDIYKKSKMPPIPTAQYTYSYNEELPFGINLFGFNTKNSAGIETQLLKAMLDAANIPNQVIDLFAPEIFATHTKEIKLYKVNLIICHAASGTPARMHLFGIDSKKHFNIGYWAWELAEVPDLYCEGLDYFQEIWTMSTFCTTALEKKAKVPVLTMPLCNNPNRNVKNNGREYFSIDKKTFLFMLAFDCTSYTARKNPMAAVDAFIKAFPPEESDHVGLLIKLVYAQNDEEYITQLREKLAAYKNIYYIHKFLDEEEIHTLIQTADVFVTLHRGEGFGLIPLEAMSQGTPVIATGWSGNMEYMNHMNSALVGYKLVPVGDQYVGTQPGDGQVWADADIDEAAAYMRRMVSDASWREKLIANGEYTANECFTAENIGGMMYKRLCVLKLIQ